MSRTPTKPGSRTPRSSSGSFVYDYDAAERARLEAQRKKEIEENRKYIKDIQETQGKIKELRDQISEAKALLANAISGEKYNEYIKNLEEQDKCLSQISSDLNERAKQAAINIRKRGEECILCEKNTEPYHNISRDNNNTFSANTEELEKLCSLLDDINTNSRYIDEKVSNITYDSKKVGIHNSYNSEDNSRNVINSTITLKNRLKQEIEDIEKVEKENTEIVDGICASTLNTLNAFMTGVANVGESLLDLGVMLFSGTTNFLFGWNMTKEEKEQLRKDTMTFVADEHVESAYSNFYENNDFGKWLDQKSFKSFKSTGSVANIASGLGEAAGTVALAAMTGGSSAVIAGAVGTGKYTEEYWANTRDNATQEEEWTTKENLTKGIVYGATNGVWEGAQWYVGGRLNNLAIEGASQLANSAVRVGTDTAMNALDTPFRSLIDAYAYDKTFSQAFEDRGGLQSTAVDVGIGLIGSIGGEVLDGFKRNKVDALELEQDIMTSKQDMVLQESEQDRVLQKLKQDIILQDSKQHMQEYFSTHPELGITPEHLEEAYKKVHFDDDATYAKRYGKGWEETGGCCSTSTGDIYLRAESPSFCEGVLNHEINHYLGDIDFYTEGRGMNEAMTEYLAKQQTPIAQQFKTAYDGNVEALGRVLDVLEAKGYGGIGEWSYFTRDLTPLAWTANKVAGDNDFFWTLSNCMNLADGCCEGVSREDVLQAQIGRDVCVMMLEDKLAYEKRQTIDDLADTIILPDIGG